VISALRYFACEILLIFEEEFKETNKPRSAPSLLLTEEAQWYSALYPRESYLEQTFAIQNQ
jgi:hypothetical protein